MEAFTWKDTFEFAQSIVDENQMAKLDKEQNLDFSFSFA